MTWQLQFTRMSQGTQHAITRRQRLPPTHSTAPQRPVQVTCRQQPRHNRNDALLVGFHCTRSAGLHRTAYVEHQLLLPGACRGEKFTIGSKRDDGTLLDSAYRMLTHSEAVVHEERQLGSPSLRQQAAGSLRFPQAGALPGAASHLSTVGRPCIPLSSSIQSSTRCSASDLSKEHPSSDMAPGSLLQHHYRPVPPPSVEQQLLQGVTMQ